MQKERIDEALASMRVENDGYLNFEEFCTLAPWILPVLASALPICEAQGVNQEPSD